MRFCVALLMVLIASPLFAKTCIRYDSNGNKIYYRCSEPERVTRFSWDVTTIRRNGEVVSKHIIPDSVCASYDSGSLERRECLKKARDKFKDNCREYKKKSGRASNENKERFYEIESNMFCEAEKELRFAR